MSIWSTYVDKLLTDPLQQILLAIVTGGITYLIVSLILRITSSIWQNIRGHGISDEADWAMIVFALLCGATAALLAFAMLGKLATWYVTPLGEQMIIEPPQ